MINNNLKFETFTEFCLRADEILLNFRECILSPFFDVREYKKYIYSGHCFSEYEDRDNLCKDKAWEWIMSYKYEEMNKNNLWSVLGQLKKGR